MAGLFLPNPTPEQIANARKWIAALRSGKYEQGSRRLRWGNRFCCLGVGCDVLGLRWGRDVKSANGFLPRAAMKALGLSTSVGAWNSGGRRSGLTALNDRYLMTFPEIADVIEQELALVTEVTA